MEQGTKRDARRRDGWVARLVQVQLAVGNLGASVEAPTADDRWPARLMHTGAMLIGMGGLVLGGWLRRHL
jgi:hypothetical protein